MSQDGSQAFFHSEAVTDIVDGVTGGLFSYTISNQDIELVNPIYKAESVGVAPPGQADGLSISDDGRFVVFDTLALGLIDGFVKNFEATEVARLGVSMSEPTASTSRARLCGERRNQAATGEPTGNRWRKKTT